MIYHQKAISLLLIYTFYLFSAPISLADEMVGLNFDAIKKELHPLIVVDSKDYDYFYNPIDGDIGFSMYIISRKDHKPFLEPDVGRVSIFRYKDRSFVYEVIQDLNHDRDSSINHFANGSCRWKSFPEKSYFLININGFYYTILGPLSDINSMLNISSLCEAK